MRRFWEAEILRVVESGMVDEWMGVREDARCRGWARFKYFTGVHAMFSYFYCVGTAAWAVGLVKRER